MIAALGYNNNEEIENKPQKNEEGKKAMRELWKNHFGDKNQTLFSERVDPLVMAVYVYAEAAMLCGAYFSRRAFFHTWSRNEIRSLYSTEQIFRSRSIRFMHLRLTFTCDPIFFRAFRPDFFWTHVESKVLRDRDGSRQSHKWEIANDIKFGCEREICWSILFMAHWFARSENTRMKW